MHRIDTEGHEDGLFVDGSPQIGQQGTIMDADWANDVQENICRVIEAAGMPLVKGDFDQLKLALLTLIGTSVPAGTVSAFAGSIAPAGYLECNGSVLARADYAPLFTAIGDAFNTGGETGAQFRLPDLRGEFVRGWDNGRGVDAGRAMASSQADDLKAHTHSLPSNSDQDGANGFVEDASGTATPRTANTGSTGGAETRPRNVALMYVIKT